MVLRSDFSWGLALREFSSFPYILRHSTLCGTHKKLSNVFSDVSRSCVPIVFVMFFNGFRLDIVFIYYFTKLSDSAPLTGGPPSEIFAFFWLTYKSFWKNPQLRDGWFHVGERHLQPTQGEQVRAGEALTRPAAELQKYSVWTPEVDVNGSASSDEQTQVKGDNLSHPSCAAVRKEIPHATETVLFTYCT